ncbi:MAG TPA: YggS family pyridoxal phosphate-dependent enzyme [Puia sp.]|nr:YggS family pyridoxal phosphate-dependent enzyme [Puia sp.]
MINQEVYTKISSELAAAQATLVAVSKTKPPVDIKQVFELGQRDFGENYVQELADKHHELPADIRWHFIGHLQTNKVKYIAPFVHLVQSVDSMKLLTEINKQAAKNSRSIDCLLQIHIAQEETKFGFDEAELDGAIGFISGDSPVLNNIRIKGLMGMASMTEDMDKVRSEFKRLKTLFDKYRQFQSSRLAFETLSMGMSNDYQVALEEGSTMVRIGSMIFGERG